MTANFAWAAIAGVLALTSLGLRALKQPVISPIFTALMFFALAMMFYVGQYAIWLVVLQVLAGLLTLWQLYWERRNAP